MNELLQGVLAGGGITALASVLIATVTNWFANERLKAQFRHEASLQDARLSHESKLESRGDFREAMDKFIVSARNFEYAYGMVLVYWQDGRETVRVGEDGRAARMRFDEAMSRLIETFTELRTSQSSLEARLPDSERLRGAMAAVMLASHEIQRGSIRYEEDGWSNGGRLREALADATSTFALATHEWLRDDG